MTVESQHFSCNFCEKDILNSGIRFHCEICSDFDICKKCKDLGKSNEEHNESHKIKIFNPSWTAEMNPKLVTENPMIQSSTGCSKFKVHNKAVHPVSLSPLNPLLLKATWNSYGEVIAWSKPSNATNVSAPIETFSKPSLLAQAVYTAFNQELPLKLNANVISITIMQHFCEYVEENAEALRSKFVDFEGKKTLLVVRDDFKYNNPDNDWESVFPEFAGQIQGFIGEPTTKMIQNCFSNTTPSDAVVSHITLMDICKNYFNYSMACGCGIPYIELLGTVADWKLLQQKVRELKRFVLEGEGEFAQWLDDLDFVMKEFVQASEGRPDLAFWGSVCNNSGLSGIRGAPVSGWVQVFYGFSGWRDAYEDAKSRGVEAALLKATSKWDREYSYPSGPKLDRFPAGLSRAPVHIKWLDVDKEEDVSFYGGLTTLIQHAADGALEVETGWAIIRGDGGKRQKEEDERRKRRW